MQDIPWHEILNAHTGAGLTGPTAKVWADELRRKFTNPPLGPEEVHNAARKLGEHIANSGSSYRQKPTLPDLIEQIQFTRNRASGAEGGRKESPEDALSRIQAEPCPFMRFSMIAAPSRRWMREELLDRLRIAGVEVRSDIRNHPRFGMRPARPADRDILAEIRERLRPVLDEDQYLREVEALLARVPLEPHPAAPIGMARILDAAASGQRREERPRVPTWEEEAVR
jgi:hypothetical protein